MPNVRSELFAIAQRRECILTLLAVIVVCGGCGPRYDLATVVGQIRLDGQPLAEAVVRFEPLQGRQSIGVTDATGHYSLRYTQAQVGVEAGHHRVMITTNVPAIPSENGSAPVEGRPELLPARYHAKTELTAEVKPGRNTIDFDLTSAAK